jgi:nitrite reductase/ring-hydroxylating ferredoxin subunit/uncharacterized membrane protein
VNPETSSGSRLIDRIAHDPRLDAAADVVQPAVDAVFAGDAPAQTLASNVLHGTWLGHPLHPLVTDIPIGAWTVGALADLLALGGDERAAFAADVATTIGVVGAFASAASGWAEWSDTQDDVRRLGILHAAFNGTAVTLYLASLGLRRAKRRGFATLLSLTGFALVGLGGYVGGELAYGAQIGTRHRSEPVFPADDFVRVAAAADVPDDGMLRADAGGIAVLLARVNGEIRAVSAVCTHRGGPLADGTREGDCVRCPWHGATFALADGSVAGPPATFPLAPFETRITNGNVEVRPIR